MGNQGMTSLKFTTFCAIALILVAGLFSTTAVALAGMITVTPSDVWEGEMNKNFILTYTADGQISNSAIQVKIPDSLIPDAGTAEEEAAFIESKLVDRQINIDNICSRSLLPPIIGAGKPLLQWNDTTTLNFSD